MLEGSGDDHVLDHVLLGVSFSEKLTEEVLANNLTASLLFWRWENQQRQITLKYVRRAEDRMNELEEMVYAEGRITSASQDSSAGEHFDILRIVPCGESLCFNSVNTIKGGGVEQERKWGGTSGAVRR